LSAHEIRLRPAPHSRTPILSYSLNVSRPSISSTGSRTFSAITSRDSCSRTSARSFDHVEVVADMTVINPFDFFIESTPKSFRSAMPEVKKRDLAPYLADR
jgi:hypothetical protein